MDGRALKIEIWSSGKAQDEGTRVDIFQHINSTLKVINKIRPLRTWASIIQTEENEF